MRSFSVFLVAMTLATACGQTQDASEVTIDSAVVKSQSSALATAITAASSEANSGGTDIAEQLADIGNTAAALIPSTKGASRAQMKGGTSTCKCTTAASKTCTFAACKIGAATASGTLSWASGQLTCSNLTFDVAAIGKTQVEGEDVTIGATHLAVTCAFTYGESTLDGSLRATGTTEVNAVDYGWDATLTATDVEWSRSSFTSGSVAVNATVTTSSDADGSASFHAAGSVTFP